MSVFMFWLFVALLFPKATGSAFAEFKRDFKKGVKISEVRYRAQNIKKIRNKRFSKI